MSEQSCCVTASEIKRINMDDRDIQDRYTGYKPNPVYPGHPCKRRLVKKETQMVLCNSNFVIHNCSIVAANKQLIARFKAKVEATLNRVWGEFAPELFGETA
jgi:hypothetical protein